MGSGLFHFQLYSGTTCLCQCQPRLEATALMSLNAAAFFGVFAFAEMLPVLKHLTLDTCGAAVPLQSASKRK